MNWLQKPWGYTACLYADSAREYWACHVLAGGYSSRHFHDLKWNRLASLDCTFAVDLWEGNRWREEIVAPLRYVDVPPGVEHRFRVLTSGRMWEHYWGRCHSQDIVRRDANGWRPPK